MCCSGCIQIRISARAAALGPLSLTGSFNQEEVGGGVGEGCPRTLLLASGAPQSSENSRRR